MSYFRASNSLHVSSTALKQAVITSMSGSTGYSAKQSLGFSMTKNISLYLHVFDLVVTFVPILSVQLNQINHLKP